MLLTTGWHPDDSQLALSSKFAPLLNAVLEQSSKTSDTRSQYSVGESVVSSEDAESASTSTFKTLMSSGTLPAEEQRIPNAAAQPGLYEISQNETIRKVAVNLHPDESKTELLPVEQWEQLGVPLYRETTAAELAFAEEQQRQLQNRELEDRQKNVALVDLGGGDCIARRNLVGGKNVARHDNNEFRMTDTMVSLVKT